MRQVHLDLPRFFNRDTYCSERSLHSLNRSLDTPVTLRTAHWTALDDHPRSTFQRSQRAPRLDQARQRWLVVRLHVDVHTSQSNFTKPSHQCSTYPFSRGCSRNHRWSKQANVFPSFSPPMNIKWTSCTCLCSSLVFCTNCGMEGASFRVRLFPVRLVVEDRVCAWSSCLRTPRAQHRPPPRSSSRILLVLLQFKFCFTAFPNFFHMLGHVGRVTPAFCHRLRLIEPHVSAVLETIRALTSSGLCSCSRYTSLAVQTQRRFLRLRSPHGGQRSFDVSVKNFMLNLLSSRTNSSLASPST